MTDAAATSVRRSMRRRVRLGVVAAGAAGVDLLSKVWASEALADRAIDLPGPLDLRLSHNPGVAFGVGDAVPAWLLLGLTAAIALVLAVAAWRGAFAGTVGPALVLGGAVANLADRLEAGTVVDMLYLGWWPTFNLADVWITVGVALLLLTDARAGAQHGVQDG